jgi:hypothetical protein
MRRFHSDAPKHLSHARTLLELDAPSDNEPVSPTGVLGRLGLLLVITFAFAMTAQLLAGAPR